MPKVDLAFKCIPLLGTKRTKITWCEHKAVQNMNTSIQINDLKSHNTPVQIKILLKQPSSLCTYFGRQASGNSVCMILLPRFVVRQPRQICFSDLGAIKSKGESQTHPAFCGDSESLCGTPWCELSLNIGSRAAHCYCSMNLYFPLISPSLNSLVHWEANLCSYCFREIIDSLITVFM